MVILIEMEIYAAQYVLVTMNYTWRGGGGGGVNLKENKYCINLCTP
jgi:hypothetical protein